MACRCREVRGLQSGLSIACLGRLRRYCENLNPATGKLLRTLSGHEANVQSVAFSPDGVWLASGDQDGAIKLWHVPTFLGL